MENYVLSYIEESTYKETMSSIVEPYLAQRKINGSFKGSNEIKVYYEKFLVNQPRAVIVISHGFCECIEKYYELIYYFNSQNYSVYALDHRSHGRSDRLGLDYTQIHVNKFSDYVFDFKIFMDTIVNPETENLSHFMFAHSMGSCIGGLFLEEHPEYFQAAILNAPMMEIHTGKFPAHFAKLVAKLLVTLGKEKQYLLGHVPFKGKVNINISGTSSEARYMYYHQKRVNDVTLQTDGGSFGWIYESFKATKRLITNADKVTIPVLLFQADNDTFVKPRGHFKFAQKAKNCKIYLVEKAKHETYFEKDTILFPYLDQVFSFYNNQLSP